MVEAQERDAMDKGMRTLWVVWAAMVSSLLIYVFICLQLGEGLIGAERTEVPIDLLKKILFGLAVAELIMAYYLRMVMLKGRSSATGLHGVRGPATLTQPPFVGHYSAAVIVSLAFSESIGIYGFVL
jgi:F0F1-type ATP synthase membrane subunit c/vacuolar-type H+-ATPase subunit K